VIPMIDQPRKLGLSTIFRQRSRRPGFHSSSTVTVDVTAKVHPLVTPWATSASPITAKNPIRTF
jgi:hypothetical protein